jgi:hypothetical protein
LQFRQFANLTNPVLGHRCSCVLLENKFSVAVEHPHLQSRAQQEPSSLARFFDAPWP